jgi:hypothetical protein
MPSAEQRTSDIVAGPGGVMTDEAGVVTGELTLASELTGDTYGLKVQYKGASEWYHVTGVQVKIHAKDDLDPMHALAVALLNRPEG